jgi:hypothetical protein
MFILFLVSFCNAAKITFKNECPFEMKLLIGEQLWTLPTDTTQDLEDSKQYGGRMYYGPSDWIDGHVSGGEDKPKSPLDAVGMLEVASCPDCNNAGDISELNFYGLPVRIDNTNRGSVGCTSTDYEGYSWQQDMIKNHCPTGAKQIESEHEVWYCPGIHEGNLSEYLVGKPIMKQWDFTKALEMNSPSGVNYYAEMVKEQPGCKAVAGQPGEPEDITTDQMSKLMNCSFGMPGEGTCNWREIDNLWEMCGILNRGWNHSNQPECFYWDYDPADTTTKWAFNPYAAFVHKTCGDYVYSTTTDDDGGNGGFFTTHNDITITVCPSAGEIEPKVCAARSSDTTTSAPGTTSQPESSTAPSTSPTSTAPTTSPGQTTTAPITTAPITTAPITTAPSTTKPDEDSGIEVTVNVEIHYGSNDVIA